MRPISFRLPEYLYYGIRGFGEPKGMGFSDSLRFIINDYLKDKKNSDNVLKRLKDIGKKIDSLPSGVTSDSTEENSKINSDLERIKKAIVILGSDSPRTKIPIVNLERSVAFIE